jgi:hypothetical protein
MVKVNLAALNPSKFLQEIQQTGQLVLMLVKSGLTRTTVKWNFGQLLAVQLNGEKLRKENCLLSLYAIWLLEEVELVVLLLILGYAAVAVVPVVI